MAGHWAMSGRPTASIEPEHLLLALARTRQGLAAEALAESLVDANALAAELGVVLQSATWSASGREALRLADSRAEERGDTTISTADLLLGLLDLADSGEWNPPRAFPARNGIRGYVERHLNGPTREPRAKPRKAFVAMSPTAADSEPGTAAPSPEVVAALVAGWLDAEARSPADSQLVLRGREANAVLVLLLTLRNSGPAAVRVAASRVIDLMVSRGVSEEAD